MNLYGIAIDDGGNTIHRFRDPVEMLNMLGQLSDSVYLYVYQNDWWLDNHGRVVGPDTVPEEYKMIVMLRE